MAMKMKRSISYSTSFGTFDDDDEGITGEELLDEYYNVGAEKKMKCRRLNREQVKALEKSFELGKRLDPEKKLKLARALSLHPRQIAIWFQNRRARWKTKQLEKDFCVLKQDYEVFKAHYANLQEENKKLQAEIQRLSNIFKDENSIGDAQISMDPMNSKDINDETCYPLQFGFCTQLEGLKSPLEGSMDQKVLTKLEENIVEEEEHCYYNLDEKTRFFWDHWP